MRAHGVEKFIVTANLTSDPILAHFSARKVTNDNEVNGSFHYESVESSYSEHIFLNFVQQDLSLH